MVVDSLLALVLASKMDNSESDMALDAGAEAAEVPSACIMCGMGSLFTGREHIVPESLGNDILVLGRGWVCDKCNNVMSGFENRVLEKSILGVERCRLGVTTKRNKPARSETAGIAWFAEPECPENVVSAEANWSEVPVVWNGNGGGKALLLLHDDTCFDIARLLLKIGVEIIVSAGRVRSLGIKCELEMAKRHILGADMEAWPYFVLLSGGTRDRLVSVFHELPGVHSYVRSCGFDMFLHLIDEEVVLFFEYGQFRAGIALTSRSVKWRQALVEWGFRHVGCPQQFANLSRP